jgi:hypothetical protein
MKTKPLNNRSLMAMPPPPERCLLDKKAEKYLREGGKLADLPEGKLKDEHPQKILKKLKETENN